MDLKNKKEIKKLKINIITNILSKISHNY